MRRAFLVVSTLLLGGFFINGCNAREPGQQMPSQQPLSTQPAEGQPQNPRVLIETSKGNITVELFAGKAPISTVNFLNYVNSGFYNGTIFHRVIPGFMIQGGGFLPDMSEKDTGKPIQNEADNGLKNLRGTLSMARTYEPHSATSQFFINVADNTQLDHRGKNPAGWGYAVFGQVVSGMDVVDAIVSAPRGSVGHFNDVPNDPVIMKKVSIIQYQ